MIKKTSRARYYERTNFAKTMKSHKPKKVIPAAKRITINISERIYEEANELDSYMGMGYQNVLKTAMTLGLSELFNQIGSHKVKA